MEQFNTLSDKPENKYLQKCEVTDTAVVNIINHLNNVSSYFKGRFFDLKEIDFPSLLMQPMLDQICSTSKNSEKCRMTRQLKLYLILFELPFFEETETKYPSTTECARKLLLPFSYKYLAKCAFSSISDLLLVIYT